MILPEIQLKLRGVSCSVSSSPQEGDCYSQLLSAECGWEEFCLKFILVPEDVNFSIKEVVAIISQITVFNLIQV